ncbi:alpha/beta hydrolase [bacterium]|nr:alpha/beta hydrolase [bacterium]
MPSPQSLLVSLAIRRLVKDRSHREEVDVPYVRYWVNRLMLPLLPHLSINFKPFHEAGLKGEWVRSRSSHNERVVLYLHGGGYFFCSPRTHRPVTSALASQLGGRTLALQYRLAPEHPYPAALNDAVAAYRWLLDQGTSPRHIAIAGDSAGGGLALTTLVTLRNQGLPMPSACVLFSPWTDMAATGASLDHNNLNCAMFSAAGIRAARMLYVGQDDPYNPLISPLYADLSGLPPTLLHVSDNEVLLDDSTRLAHRAREAGVDIDFKVWTDQPHTWQLFHRLIPEGKASLLEATHFLSRHFAASWDGLDLPYSMP